MNKKKSLSIRRRIKSVSYAMRGLRDMILTEPNAKIHAAITIIVLLLCLWLGITGWDLGLIITALVSVWMAEAFNTVIEIVMDYVTSRQYSPMVERAKDISACAVLIASLGAFVIGIIILGPPLLERMKEVFNF